MARAGVPLVEVLRLPGFSFDDLPPDAPDHEVAESHQSRLGKGLASIIPGADAAAPRRRAGGVASVIPLAADTTTPGAPAEAGGAPDTATTTPAAAPAPAAPRRVPAEQPAEQPVDLPPEAVHLVARLHGDLVTALLDGLAAAAPCDLVAYLHQPDRAAPRLHLGRPALGELTPDRCFDLCLAMDARAGGRPGVVEAFRAGGFDGVAVVVAGPAARGLWVAARHGQALADDVADDAVDYARHTGAAASLVDLRQCQVPAAAPSVQVRVEEGQVRAEVALAGGRATAGAPTGVEAAARATVEAAGSPAEFLYAAAAREGATAASLVLLRDGARVHLGCAAGELEPPGLTATAALRAAGLEVASR